jgi:hypothetical protein
MRSIGLFCGLAMIPWCANDFAYGVGRIYHVWPTGSAFVGYEICTHCLVALLHGYVSIEPGLSYDSLSANYICISIRIS